MRIETIVLNKERHVTLTSYILDVEGEFRNIAKRPAVLVLPGGGYQYCSDREADPVAFPYLKAGYHVFILRYSIKEDAVWPTPLNDYEQAMEFLFEKGDEWKIYTDRIAVIGFSAGGHLAACAATMAKNKPAAAILGYAVTRGDMAKICNPTAPDVVGAVDVHTSPCFMFASRTDNIVPVVNTIDFMKKLDENGISFEAHVYAYGPHGFSTSDSSVQQTLEQCSRIPDWVEDSIEWLRDMMGDFGESGMTEPRCKKYVNGNRDEYLSVYCTLNHLLANKEAAQILSPLLKGYEQQLVLAGNMLLKDAIGFVKQNDGIADALDEQLKKIRNNQV